MKTFTLLTALIALMQCSSGSTPNVKSNGEFDEAHGPFDSNGNYVESWADKPPMRRNKKIASRTNVPTKSKAKPRQSSTTRPSKSRNTAQKSSKSKRKPKSKPRKITPKAKPPIMHKVVRGDTLSRLARKYGSTISDIKKVNKLKGTMIKIGQRLLIPRK